MYGPRALDLIMKSIIGLRQNITSVVMGVAGKDIRGVSVLWFPIELVAFFCVFRF